MRKALLGALALLSTKAFAVDYNYEDAEKSLSDGLSNVEGFTYLPLITELAKLFFQLGILILGLMLLYLTLRYMADRDKTKGGNGYTFGMRILNVIYGFVKLGLGLAALRLNFYIVGVFIATVYSSFFLASAIDREKHISDVRQIATVNGVEFINRAVNYKADMLQLQRKYAFDKHNLDFISCLKQDYKLEINEKTKVVIDRNQINFSECADKHLGIDKIKFATIPYDNNLSLSANKKLLSIIDDSVYLAHAFINNECSTKDKIQDEHNYLAQCSLMTNNVVVPSSSKYMVSQMDAKAISAETLNDSVDMFVARYADVAVSEVESYLDKKQADIEKELAKIQDKEYGPWDLITATFRSSAIISEVDGALITYTTPSAISINLSVLTNNTAEKFRYKARGGKSEKVDGSYEIKKAIGKFFAIYQHGTNYTQGLSKSIIAQRFNSSTNNAYSKYGFSNDECIYDHKKCNVPSMNLAAQNLALGKMGVTEHFTKVIQYSLSINALQSLLNSNPVVFTSTQVLKSLLWYEKLLLGISFTILMYIVSRIIFNQFGNYMKFAATATLWMITIVPQTIIKTTAQELDKGNFKLDLNYPLYFLSFGLVVSLSFIYGLFLLNVGAAINQLVAPIVVASIIPAGLEILANFAIHLFFYVMMGYLFNRTLGLMDKQFLGEYTKSLIDKADDVANDIADDVHNKLTGSLHNLK
jgi:hypothetical protein